MRQSVIQVLIRFLLLLNLMSCGKSSLDKGDLCLAMGDYRMAISFYMERLSERPGDCNARMGLGKALLQKAADSGSDLDSWEYGLVQLEACRHTAVSDGMEMLLSDAYTEKARLLLNTGDTLNALGSLSRAMEYAPQNVGPINLAGIVYYNMGDAYKSEALFLKSIGIDSLHPTALYNLGVIRLVQGNYAGSREVLVKALQILPGDEDVLYWFARAEKAVRKGM